MPLQTSLVARNHESFLFVNVLKKRILRHGSISRSHVITLIDVFLYAPGVRREKCSRRYNAGRYFANDWSFKESGFTCQVSLAYLHYQVVTPTLDIETPASALFFNYEC